MPTDNAACEHGYTGDERNLCACDACDDYPFNAAIVRWYLRLVCALLGHIRWASDLGGDCVRCGR